MTVLLLSAVCIFLADENARTLGYGQVRPRRSRDAGQMARWVEMMADPKLRISRPRQLYTAHATVRAGWLEEYGFDNRS